MNNESIPTLVARLSRPHPSGGHVIERAAILAAGADSSAVLAWIETQGGEPEALAPVVSERGLHSARLRGNDGDDVRAALRYVLPAGALD